MKFYTVGKGDKYFLTGGVSIFSKKWVRLKHNARYSYISVSSYFGPTCFGISMSGYFGGVTKYFF